MILEYTPKSLSLHKTVLYYFVDNMLKFTPAGLGVALVTPFKEDFSIDFDSLESLINHIITGNADYIVVLGTTAETPTLSKSERLEIRDFVRAKVAERIPLVLGVSSNDTESIVSELKENRFDGYSAILSAVPFYNKPSQEGIYQHFASIAEATDKPVILYNIPSRTGVNMQADTTIRLSCNFSNIIGIKEASGNIAQISKILANKDSDFSVISGDDSLTLPLMSIGTVGVISVIGNAFPEYFGKLVHSTLNHDIQSAQEIHTDLNNLFHLLFAEGNPAGIKCLLNKLGLCNNVLRRPLCSVSLETEKAITQEALKF